MTAFSASLRSVLVSTGDQHPLLAQVAPKGVKL